MTAVAEKQAVTRALINEWQAKIVERREIIKQAQDAEDAMKRINRGDARHEHSLAIESALATGQWIAFEKVWNSLPGEPAP